MFIRCSAPDPTVAGSGSRRPARRPATAAAAQLLPLFLPGETMRLTASHQPPRTRRGRGLRVVVPVVVGVLCLVAAVPSAAVDPRAAAQDERARADPSREDVRFMTYNASLNREQEGQLQRDLAGPGDQQASRVAEVIQINDPDVVLLNEFDHDAEHRSAALFRENYLEVSQNGQEPVEYPYVYTAPVNTGVDSGLDLDADGRTGTADDAWGFGQFPGQYGMVLYSKHPIGTDDVRTFQDLRWAEMPGSLLPWEHYGREIGEQLRLSSKSHWDIPIRVGAQTVHVLASHPTPPSFDGPEDRNGRRNHDEIRFWADYVSGPRTSGYIHDDEGGRGGLRPGSRFVVMGDQNSDPRDGDSWPGSAQLLTVHPRIQDPLPASRGAVEASALQGGLNDEHLGDPRYDTADFGDGAPGNLRADYVLPSRNLLLRDAGVYWPRQDEPGAELTGTYPFPTSDHRPVWVDLALRTR